MQYYIGGMKMREKIFMVSDDAVVVLYRGDENERKFRGF